MKKDIIRIGDTVKIINPEFFVRVGYPLDFQMAFKTVYDEHIQKINKLLIDSGVVNKYELHVHKSRTNDTQHKIARAMAYEYMKKKKFGGNERKIYTERLEKYQDQMLYVYGKDVVKTGTYYPPSGGLDYWGEYDYEPGGLDNMKTHIILTVGVDGIYPYYSKKFSRESGYLFIESKYVEKIS